MVCLVKNLKFNTLETDSGVPGVFSEMVTRDRSTLLVTKYCQRLEAGKNRLGLEPLSPLCYFSV